MLKQMTNERSKKIAYIGNEFEILKQSVKQVDTVVIGGGQAGLAMSYYLTQVGRGHIVLEKSLRIGETWRKRWDSFSLVTPNWQLQLPGFSYKGKNPDGFLKRDEIVNYLEEYAKQFDPPIQFGATVTAVKPLENGRGYCIQTNNIMYEAKNVVVATGTFQKPKIPAFSKNLAQGVTQIHSSQYRNPQMLPEGAVLVVGSGQSGSQIAQELNENGRKVYLAVGSAGRLLRRYRGKDGLWWAKQVGMFEKTVDQLESVKARFAANPHLTGRDGGGEINLHQFARDGITLLGHLQDIQDNILTIAPDLKDNLANIDNKVATFKANVDKFIEMNGLTAPQAEADEEPGDGYEQPIITALDMATAGITTIIWATGYRWDFSWIDLPIFDQYGYPIQQRGVTDYQGFYFLGLFWMHKFKSGLLYGVGEDAAYVAAQISKEPVLA